VTSQDQRHVVKADDGHEIHVRTWRPDGEVNGVVQLLHGLGEHIGRYERFANACVSQGMAVVAHNHRGHGPECDQYGYFAAREGWQKVLTDVLAVHNDIKSRFDDQPIILFGHSMGSFIAQAFAINFATPLAGLALSGSGWPSRLQMLPGRLVAKFEAWRLGKHGYSTFLDRLGFGAFNKPFKPARTEFDWLSRDEAEVDKYIADELCGGPFTSGLWLDMLGGLADIGGEAALRRIPAELPIYIVGGTADPVGGDKGLGKLAFHYAQTGHGRLRVKIYPDGRHEMLNETNRDEVMADLIEWFTSCSSR
jgi:alpha-beta hydrolase superfamily lysophospholipase